MMRTPGLAARQALGVEEVPRFRRRRQVQGDVVGASRTARRASSSSTPSVPATCSEMNGSCATMCMPNERARGADFLADPAEPDDAERLAAQLGRRSASSFPTRRASSRVGGRELRAPATASAPAPCSATLMLLAPGAFMTTMPRAVAAGDVDVVDAGAGARDDSRSCGAAAMSAAVTFVALRTTSASASARSRASSAGERPAAGVDGPAPEQSTAEPAVRSAMRCAWMELIGDDDVHDWQFCAV